MTLDDYEYFLEKWQYLDPFNNDGDDYWDFIPGSQESGKMGVLMIPEGVTRIEAEAFCDCRLISVLHIPSTVETIEFSAFCGCRSLKKLTFSEGISFIGKAAFAGLHQLTAVSLPDSLSYIGRNVFSECDNLKSITLCGNQPLAQRNDSFHFDTEAYELKTSRALNDLTEALYTGKFKNGSFDYIEGTTGIEDDAFDDCPNLTSIIIQDCVTFTRKTPFSTDDVKYASVLGSYMKNKNPLSERYIRRNAVLIFWFLVENGDMDMIRRFLDMREFITRENIDDLIGCSIFLTGTTDAIEIRATLLHYKSEVLGYGDPRTMFGL